MFDWFRRLIPQPGDFFSMFERHSAATVAAAEALQKMLRGDGDRTSLVQEIRDHEHAADSIIREVLQEVRQTFLTPFDRGAITGLIVQMDDTIDEIQACASAIETYDVTEFDHNMLIMAERIVEATHKINSALPLLRDITRNGQNLHQLTAEIVSIEGAIDILHTDGLRANYARAMNDQNSIRFIVVREVFKHLEKIADAFEDVANQIDGIVIDHA